MKLRLSFILLASIVLTPLATAQSIESRQDNQARRITQGVASGELTAQETRKLGKQQMNIAKTKADSKSDGHFTRRERAKIHQKQNRASQQIYRKKHNARSRN